MFGDTEGVIRRRTLKIDRQWTNTISLCENISSIYTLESRKGVGGSCLVSTYYFQLGIFNVD
jgi:hypothetical protein